MTQAVGDLYNYIYIHLSYLLKCHWVLWQPGDGETGASHFRVITILISLIRKINHSPGLVALAFGGPASISLPSFHPPFFALFFTLSPSLFFTVLPEEYLLLSHESSLPCWKDVAF